MATTTTTAFLSALATLIQAANAEALTPAQKAEARAVVAAAQAITTLLTAASAPTTTTIVVGSADTLWSIAAAVYGDARKFGGLVLLNNLTDPRLTLGQTLIVPAR